MHDTHTVALEIRRPPLTLRELKPRKLRKTSRQRAREYRHRHIGFLNIRSKRFECAHCDDGKVKEVKEDMPSYHRNAGLYPGDPCPDCLGRGYSTTGFTRRPYLSFAFFRAFGYEWHIPSLITIWHVDPDHQGDDDSCRRNVRRRQLEARKDERWLADQILWWRFKRMHLWHVHHWKIQVRPVQTFRRWLFTRCAQCGNRLPYGYSPVSVHWDSMPHKWYESEVGVYHHECYDQPQRKKELVDA
jgi:hypothetical protein